MQCGPICYQEEHKGVREHSFKRSVISKMIRFTYEWSDGANIYELWPKLINNKDRNNLIVEDIGKIIHDGRFPIILTERREHLKILEDMLQGKIDYLAVLHGGLSPKKRREILKELRNCSKDKRKAILATGSYIGEGFDEPQLDTLFITMPISFKGKVVQYAGRLHRNYNGKEEVRIYDYVDKEVTVLWSMYKKRLKAYKFMGYEIS